MREMLLGLWKRSALQERDDPGAWQLMQQVLVLESLQDRDDHARNGTRRAVERVRKLQISLQGSTYTIPPGLWRHIDTPWARNKHQSPDP